MPCSGDVLNQHDWKETINLFDKYGAVSIPNLSEADRSGDGKARTMAFLNIKEGFSFTPTTKQQRIISRNSKIVLEIPQASFPHGHNIVDI